MTKIIARRSSKHRVAGFTMVEVMVSLAIMSFLMLGAMDMFVNSLRMADRSTAEVFATQDAANAMRSIQDSVRESLWLALPDSADAKDGSGNLWFSDELSNFPSLSGYSASDFIAWDPTGTYSADTALFLASPTVDNTPTFNTSSKTGVTAPYELYNRGDSSSGGIMIYRADADGTPDAHAGAYLWEISEGASPTINKAVIASVDTNDWNAVQFARPDQSSSTPFHYQVEVKITSAYYSAINGQQTSDATNGSSTTQLVGRCVSMRDHETSGTHYPTGGTLPSGFGNRFQATGSTTNPG